MKPGHLFFLYLFIGPYFSHAQPTLPDTSFRNFQASDTSGNQRFDYLLVTLKKGESIAALTSAHVKPIRQLSPQHYIVAAKEVPGKGFESVSPANNNWKLSVGLSDLLLNKKKYLLSSNLYSLVVSNIDTFKNELRPQNEGISVIREYISSNTVTIQINTREAFERILGLRSVMYIANENRKAMEEQALGSLDLTANKVNYVHSQAPALNGTGLVLSVKENKPDTNDIDFRGRILFSPLSSGIVSNHATVMCTIAAGAGNSFYSGKGVAWGARISSSNFLSLMPDPDTAYFKHGISVQNHSYGTGIENYYGHDAMAYDISSNLNPVLLHVFSSGNSGNLTSTAGNYSGIEGFANITGSFKMAKNILSVGSTDSLGNVVAASSRGPAFDGRVKPELVAFGEDGSSGAAAIVSGLCLLLQQAYKEMHGGQLPASALVKAVLVNSADDAGVKGIDYNSGYGNLNAYKALNTIRQATYMHGSIEQGGSHAFDIQVPEHAKNLKITLCWNDPASTVNAFTALVNNIDMRLLHPGTGTYWDPWVLNSRAHKDSLQLLPTRQKDTLNNVELITVEVPMPGNYRIQVNGATITGPQEFYIAYQWDTLDTFSWMHPVNNDNVLSGTSALLRWQSGFSDTGKIEYALNGGTDWRVIESKADLSKGYFRWAVPDTFATALLRITIKDKMYVSDTFTISKPLQAYVGYNCPDSLLLFWNKLNQPAAGFVLYRLGSMYMEAVASYTDTVAVLSKSTHPSLYYAVSPVLSGGRHGMKSYSFNYTTQGTGCYLKSFLADKGNDATAVLNIELGTNYQVKKIEIQKSSNTATTLLPQIEPVNGLQYTILDSLLTKGLNIYRVKITLYNGKIIYSNQETVYNIQKNSFIVFPNPVQQSQLLNILSDDPESTLFQIFSMDGRQLLQRKLTGSLEQLPVSRLRKGVFVFAIWKKGEKLMTGKLIVK